MGTRNEDDTKVVLRKLFFCLLAFYVLYYTVSLVLCASFGIFSSETWKLPFTFEAFESFSFSRKVCAVAWISLASTYALSVGIVYYIVRCTRKAWDYSISVSILHLGLSCLVSLGFPTQWVWWVTMVAGTLVMGGLGELSCYYIRDMRDIELDH